MKMKIPGQEVTGMPGKNIHVNGYARTSGTQFQAHTRRFTSWEISGTPKIDDFGPFFKNRYPKFLPTRKKRVFRVAVFFLSRGNRGCFWGTKNY